MSDSLVLLVVGGGTLAAVTLVAYLLISRLGKDESSLVRLVGAYDEDGPLPTTPKAEADGARLAALHGLVPRVATLLRLGPVVVWTERRLDQANLALRPPEALFSAAVAAVLGGVLGLVTGGIFIAALLFMLLLAVPPLVLSNLAKKRRRKFTTQLPETLVLLASSLKAGYSFLQGVDAVSQEVREPMASELRRVLVEGQLGRPVEEALQECADRMESPDFEWAVSAVTIQREVGGNLAELLETVAETMVDRERLRRDVRGLTAEGRVSAIVLGILPPGVGTAMYVMNPGYMKVLFHNSGGKAALLGAGIAMLVGFVWMNKVIDVDL